MFNTSFWSHLFYEYALINGWNVDQDLEDFIPESGLDLEHATYATLASGESLSFADVLEASKVGTSDKIRNFFIALVEYSPGLKDVGDDEFVLTSMHSGSSEYLTMGDIRKIIE